MNFPYKEKEISIKKNPYGEVNGPNYGIYYTERLVEALKYMEDDKAVDATEFRKKERPEDKSKYFIGFGHNIEPGHVYNKIMDDGTYVETTLDEDTVLTA